MNTGANVDRVKAVLNSRAEEVCRFLLPGGRRIGREWRAGNIQGDKGGSLCIELEGGKVGLWRDWANPSDAGDVLTLWQRCRNLPDFPATLADAARWAGVPLANGNGADHRTLPPRQAPSESPEPKARQSGRDMAAEWARCVEEMEDSDLASFAKWRGYTVGFSRWLKCRGLLGYHGDKIAFPVHQDGRVLGWHFRIEEDRSWRYYPKGIGTHPLAVGIERLKQGTPFLAVFESQFDALAFMDRLAFHEKDLPVAVLATRGASNAKLIAPYLEDGVTVIAFGQNDEPGQKWVEGIAEEGRRVPGVTVKSAKVPSIHKDLNDWTLGGATLEEVQRAFFDAAVIHKADSGDADLGVVLQRAEAVRDTGAVEVQGEAESEECEGDTLPNPGRFPIESFPGAMREIVETVAEVFELPPELPGMAALATWAGAIGKAAVVRGAVNGRDTPCNLFAFIGAPKSFGKGSAAAVVRPFLDHSLQRAEDFRERELPHILARLKIAEKESANLTGKIATGRSGKGVLTEAEKGEARERLVAVERDAAELKRLAEGLPSYHAGSATGAALAQVLRRNAGTVFSYSPEAGDMVRVALGRFTADAKADCDLLLSGYTVEPFKESRVGRGEVSLTPCLTALWFCQPSLLREIIGNEEAFERGLTARALIFCCEREGPIPHDDGTIRQLDAGAVQAWAAALAEVVKRREVPDPFPIPCDAQAREVFRGFHNEAVDYRNGRFRDVEAELGRWRENAIRIAGGLTLAEGAESVTRGIAERAVSLARWAHLSGLALLNVGAEERRRARVERIADLARAAGGTITLRRLRDSHGVREDEVEHLARLYPSRLAVEARPIGAKGGRPSRIVRLANP